MATWQRRSWLRSRRVIRVTALGRSSLLPFPFNRAARTYLLPRWRSWTVWIGAMPNFACLRFMEVGVSGRLRLASGEKPPASIREPERARGIPWEGRDDHPKRPGTGGSRGRGRCADVRRLRVAAPFRRGRVDPVRRPRPYAATGVAVFRPALARRGGRVPLHAFGRGDRDRGGWSPPAPSRRRSLLAGGRGECPSGREPFGRALLLPHPRLSGYSRRRPLPRAGRDPVRLRRRDLAAAAHRRDPDQGRKGFLSEDIEEPRRIALFTQVPGRGILRTSPVRRSPKVILQAQSIVA